MGNSKKALLLTFVAAVCACTSSDQIWVPVDIPKGPDSIVGLLESRTKVFDSVKMEYYLDSFAENYQKWMLTVGGQPVCSIELREDESLIGFWATGPYLYAHKLIMVDLKGGTEESIVRYNESCEEESCMDLARYVTDGTSLQFRTFVPPNKAVFDRLAPPSTITEVIIEVSCTSVAFEN